MIRGSKYVIVNITQAICNSTYMLIINSLASRGYNSVHCPRSGSRTPYRWFVRTKRLLRSELRNPCIFGEHRIAHGVLLDLYPISRYQPYALPSGVWWSCSQLLKSYFHTTFSQTWHCKIDWRLIECGSSSLTSATRTPCTTTRRLDWCKRKRCQAQQL